MLPPYIPCLAVLGQTELSTSFQQNQNGWKSFVMTSTDIDPSKLTLRKLCIADDPKTSLKWTNALNDDQNIVFLRIIKYTGFKDGVITICMTVYYLFSYLFTYIYFDAMYYVMCKHILTVNCSVTIAVFKQISIDPCRFAFTNLCLWKVLVSYLQV